MTTRSILKIPVDDADFKKFAELFEKHKKSLSEMPEEWKKVAAAASTSYEGLHALIAANQEMEEKRIRDLKQESHHVQEYWQSLARSSKTFASNIKDATTSLLRWASVGSVVAGLTGAGGLFGIDRLALGVASNRRASMGLGSSYGGRQAFNTNFGRLVDGDSFMGGVNTSLHDLSQRWRLASLGLGNAHGDTSEISTDALTRIRTLLRNTPESQLANVMQSRGLDAFMGLDRATTLRNTSDDEYNSLLQNNRHDRASLGLTNDTQRKWQDFSTQLHRAGQQLENVFVRGLTPLTPALERLSVSVTKSVETLMKNLANNGLIDKIGAGIEAFAGYIGSDTFQADLKTIAGSLNTFASDALALGGKFHNALVDLGIVKNGSVPKGNTPIQNFANRIRGDNPEVFGPFANLLPDIANAENVQRKNGTWPVSPKGALGKYQLMPATAKALGVDPLNDKDAAYGAAKLLGQLDSRYHDIRKDLAAYNWNPSGLDKDIAKNGVNWEKHLPNETAAYLAKVIGSHNKRLYDPRTAPGMKITVQDGTGSDMYLSGTQLTK